MLKLLIILTFVFGIIFYVGYMGYERILAISRVNAAINYYKVDEDTVRTSIMTLLDCQSGNLPFIPSYQGKITIEPYNVRLIRSGQLRITNADSVPHTIGIAYTKIWEAINPGDSFDLLDYKLPFPTGNWFITCDGINLGDKSPSIIYQAL